MKPLALLAAFRALLAANAAARPSSYPAMHFLAIGSEHYARHSGNSLSSFGNIIYVGAEAADVAELFRRGAARSARILRSYGRGLVSRNDGVDRRCLAVADAS